MNDQEIIILLKSGKESTALKSLYENFTQIKSMIIKSGGSKDEAEEIFQRALLVFLENVRKPGFELTSSIGTYLYSTCRFMFYDKKRSQLKEQKYIQEALKVSSEDLDSKLEIEEREQRFEKMNSIISQLGERCKELLHKFYVENKNMKTIAVEMGLSSDKVAKNQKYKCIERAKKLKNI